MAKEMRGASITSKKDTQKTSKLFNGLWASVGGRGWACLKLLSCHFRLLLVTHTHSLAGSCLCTSSFDFAPTISLFAVVFVRFPFVVVASSSFL